MFGNVWILLRLQITRLTQFKLHFLFLILFCYCAVTVLTLNIFAEKDTYVCVYTYIVHMYVHVCEADRVLTFFSCKHMVRPSDWEKTLKIVKKYIFNCSKMAWSFETSIYIHSYPVLKFLHLISFMCLLLNYPLAIINYAEKLEIRWIILVHIGINLSIQYDIYLDHWYCTFFWHVGRSTSTQTQVPDLCLQIACFRTL